MYGRKISPFYRTLSPIGAAALPPPMKTKEKVEPGKGSADHLMPLGYFFLIGGDSGSLCGLVLLISFSADAVRELIGVLVDQLP